MGLVQKSPVLAHVFIWVRIGANLKNIFVSPYPTLFYRYGSVGLIVFSTYQTGYPSNLIVNSPSIGNKFICTQTSLLLTKTIY